jgi:SAM-dependent methyltransferase
MTDQAQNSQPGLDSRNAAFWDELCGSAMARELGITDASAESLARFDREFLAHYPYLPRYLDHPFPLHGVTDRVELLWGADDNPAIPLDDASVAHVNCQSVLHHTIHPNAILAELARVLRPGGTATIMVYNRDSIWLHLHTAYERMVLEDEFPGLGIDEAFARNTDGHECPISRCYRADDFLAMCQRAGFEGEAVGGHLSRHELKTLKTSWSRAIADDRLAPEHRTFLRELTFDFNGFPQCRGRHAGIGGTYRLRRP